MREITRARPGPDPDAPERALRAVRGAECGALLCTAFLAAVSGVGLTLGLGRTLDPVVGALMCLVLFAGPSLAVSAALRWSLSRLGLPGGPVPGLAGALGGAAALAVAFPIPSVEGAMYATLWIVCAAALGAGLALARSSALGTVTALTGGVGIGVLVAWLWLPVASPRTAGAAAIPASLRSAATPGPFAVERSSYGSGRDRRQRYGAGVPVESPTVDLSPHLPSWSAWRGRLRRAYWGFTPAEAPLNALVWAPAAPGPFPLVLILHGNHAMEVDSETGYGYLAEHLASHGYVVASIDANFLNRSWSGDPPGTMRARAELVLAHLALWSRWATKPGHPFAGLVDLDRVGLVGHSRGGEAASLAAALAGGTGADGPGGRAVAAHAPTDGMGRLDGPRVVLRDTSYLVVLGSHDAQVPDHDGLRQYGRVEMGGDPSLLKLALHVRGANHVRFNTAWGSSDWPWPASPFLLRAPLIGAEIQREVARAAVTTFLEATVREDPSCRVALRALLGTPGVPPPDLLLARFSSGDFEPIARFDEERDPAGPGGSLHVTGGARWHLEAPRSRRFRDAGSRLAVVETMPDVRSRARWEIRPDPAVLGSLRPGDDSVLRLSLATPGDVPGLRLELVSLTGDRVSLPLDTGGVLTPEPQPRLTRFPNDEALFGGPVPPLVRTLEIPLAREHASLDAGHLARIALVVPGRGSERILVDEITWGPPRSDRPEGSCDGG